VHRTTWIAAAGVTGALALAGCGGSSSDSGSSSGSGASAASTPTASGGGSSAASGSLALAANPSGKLMFDKKTLTAKAGKVTIAFTNQSGIPHAIAVEGNGVDKDGKVITKGSNQLTVNLKPGKYTFYCPVDGHRQAGMQGTLTVK
jgi:uncharacterized cupredoxin-like copper-binding protein